MKKYFESKIGQYISKSFTTGDTFYTGVYKRKYNIDILTVTAKEIQVKVTSSDYAPSGFGRYGSDKSYPARTFSYSKTENIDQIIDKICRTYDYRFFSKYPNLKS